MPLALGLALLAALAFAAPAFAARGHEFAGAFGWGVLDGKGELQRCSSEASCKPGLSGNEAGEFNNPDGIAVSEATGDVYVVDEANNRVEIFNASGTKFEGEFDGSGTHLNEGITPAGFGGGAEEVKTGQFQEPEGIAVDNDPASPSFGDVYVADAEMQAIIHGTQTRNPVVDKFSATGEFIGQITRNPGGEFPESGFRRLFGVAIDPRGEVWVDEINFGSPVRGVANYTNAVANAWIAFRSTESGILPAAGFLAVDSEENLYAHNTLGGIDRLSKFGESGELLTPEVDEEAPTGVAVELSSDDVYISHTATVHRVGPNGESLESLKAPGAPSLTGVAVNHTTLTVYVADAAAGRIDVFTPEGSRAPTVEAGSTAVSEVTDKSADFSAEVNPRSEPNEEATSYAFRYSPCETPATCSSSPYTQSTPVPEGTLAPNYEPDVISAHPQDLLPHTVYHMRVVAHNSHPGVAEGEELIFTTQGPPAAALPDHRRYELVSPPDKHGAILQPIGASGVIQVAADGDAASYVANAPTEAEPQGFSRLVQVLSRRGSSAWESQDIATPHEGAVGQSLGVGIGEYRFFSEELESAVVQPFGGFTKAISPAASEQTPYLRQNFPAGDPAHPCTSSCYRPLVSGCPGEGEACPKAVEEVANVPEGTKFGKKSAGEGGTCVSVCGPYFLGASADASHIVLESEAPLTAEEAPEGGLYEWSAGKLALVSALPKGEAAGGRAVPALGFFSEGSTIRIARNAISTDGTRVVWSARELNVKGEPTGNLHLYLRDLAGEEAQTLQLDKPEAACTSKGGCKGTAKPVFQTASADDSRIFFTDPQPLTQTSGNSDLYECLLEETEEGELVCKLSDLTPPGEGEAGAGVLGLVAGASEDGSTLYFTANGKLSEGPNQHEEEAVAGDCKGDTTSNALESETAPEHCNLYERSGGQTRLVAVLSGADFPDWALREAAGLGVLSDRVSLDGRYLAFMSRRALSNYDNRDAQSNKADEEVFLYDSATSTLSCASCNPSGGRPRGVRYANVGLAGGSQVWPAGAWIAASIPGWTPITAPEGFALYQSRYLSDAGRLFFNAADALVPQDSNKTEDVYEYEPQKVGDCEATLASFAPASGGCVTLISSGTAKEESAFLDASQSGDDVFFLTGARLLPSQDVDLSLDVYDAHACSSSSPCLPEAPTPTPPCEGDACQSPGAPTEDQTPGSLTYQGPGNPPPPAAQVVKHKSAAELKAEKLKKALKACHKQKSKRKRLACEAKARKRRSTARKAKKSSRRSMV